MFGKQQRQFIDSEIEDMAERIGSHLSKKETYSFEWAKMTFIVDHDVITVTSPKFVKPYTFLSAGALSEFLMMNVILDEPIQNYQKDGLKLSW